MFANRFTVVLDANVLGPALPRNLTLSLAREGLLRPRWSAEVLHEVQRFILKRTGDEQKAKRQTEIIHTAFPEGLVDLSSEAIRRLVLPDQDDRHVLAAAIKAKAQLIVTDNLKDFPQEVLADFELEAVSADKFLVDTMDLFPHETIDAVRTMRLRLKNPTLDAASLILKCERSRLLETASWLSAHQNLI